MTVYRENKIYLQDPSVMPFKSKRKSGYTTYNQVKLVRGGSEYFDLLEQMIDQAQRSIHLQTYILEEDETGKRIVNALLRALERDVKIFVIVDGYGSQALSREFIERLKNAGIFFRKFRPFFKSKRFYLGRRLHHKVIVVDSYRCMAGGMNISNRYNDTAENTAWLDWALYVEGEVAPQLEHICISRLKKRIRTDKNSLHPMPRKKCLVRISVNDWARTQRQIYKSYLQMFKEASSYMLIMSSYFLPGWEFRKEIEKAVKRGVRVKVVLTGNADVPLVKYAERYVYHWLFKNKIEIYEYKKNVLHCKLAIRDGEWITVGSYNVNNLSAFGSIELNLDVNDKDFVQQAEPRLQHIIDHDCVRITEEVFNRKTNFVKRILHKSAYELCRFLVFISTKQG